MTSQSPFLYDAVHGKHLTWIWIIVAIAALCLLSISLTVWEIVKEPIGVGLLVQMLMEVLYGTSLLFFFRNPRCAATSLLISVGFLSYTIGQWVAGFHSCGCMPGLAIPPEIMAATDGIILGGLIAAYRAIWWKSHLESRQTRKVVIAAAIALSVTVSSACGVTGIFKARGQSRNQGDEEKAGLVRECGTLRSRATFIFYRSGCGRCAEYLPFLRMQALSDCSRKIIEVDLSRCVAENVDGDDLASDEQRIVAIACSQGPTLEVPFSIMSASHKTSILDLSR